MKTRVGNWPELLAEYVEQRRKEPFAWGSNDCCIFAADWVQACTGTDYASAWRGRYTGELGAARFLKEAGGLEALVDSLAFQRVARSLVGRGDVVAQEGGRGPTLGICLGASAVFVHDNGLIFGAIQNVQSAWRI